MNLNSIFLFLFSCRNLWEKPQTRVLHERRDLPEENNSRVIHQWLGTSTCCWPCLINNSHLRTLCAQGRGQTFSPKIRKILKFFPLTPAPLPSTPKNCLTSSQARIVRKWNWWTFDILWWKQLWDFPGQEMALTVKYPNLFSWNIWKWKWSRCLFYLQMSSSAVENVRINKPPVAAWWRHSRLATGHLMKSGPATFRSAPFQSCFFLNYESISYKTECLRSFRVKHLKCTAAFWIFVEI